MSVRALVSQDAASMHPSPQMRRLKGHRQTVILASARWALGVFLRKVPIRRDAFRTHGKGALCWFKSRE